MRKGVSDWLGQSSAYQTLHCSVYHSLGKFVANTMELIQDYQGSKGKEISPTNHKAQAKQGGKSAGD